ncbi:MAG: CDGSH iron-sulfur domain-containing protein [Leptolyngbyaceae cyanobacterium MO_188.B28]|nr:CDGSH iron-sulfur domain-containing protein [Leptolyngbyaceae cyanobacterium MO_188.B28]
MSDSEAIKYSGKSARVSWRGSLCIHIGECGRAKGALFVGGRQPWCQPDLASDDEVKDVVMRCPTGALSVEFDDQSILETASPENTINVAYNGPLFVRGQLEIEGAPSDAPGLKFRAALCRCGQSKNKPFCDNSHEDTGFKDYGAVGETGEPSTGSGGPLAIKAVKNGPLLIKGNVTIYSGSGRSSWRGDQVALCRCGVSENKPFCDGSHKKVGFISD